jgi:hypothetical protein
MGLGTQVCLVCTAFLGCATGLVPAQAGPTSTTFGDPLRLREWRPATAVPLKRPAAATAGAVLPLLGGASATSAAVPISMGSMDAMSLDPTNFQPVCPASDGFYRFSQSLITGVVGPESYKEYAPLIAGGLLRVRLELCVLESFFYEAIIPFIRENGTRASHDCECTPRPSRARPPDRPTCGTSTRRSFVGATAARDRRDLSRWRRLLRCD